MSQPEETRLSMELELLEAMYPSQVQFNPRSRDFKFSDQSALLHLRLPSQYPDAGIPEVISANDNLKNDIRDQIKAASKSLGLAEGDEALDAIIACFKEVVATTDEEASHNSRDTPNADAWSTNDRDTDKTIVIWLHHLLALGKRKLALAPANSVAGITKPGYPGIMVFSGPVPAITEHVNTLKAQNWQAFQVRYEDEGRWQFAHGNGVIEVETMAEVVKDLEGQSHNNAQKEAFLKATGIK